MNLRRTAFGFFFTFTLSFSAPALADDRIEIQGSLQMGSGRDLPYVVILEGNQWSIRISSPGKGTEYVETGSDGVDSFEVVKLSSEADRSQDKPDSSPIFASAKPGNFTGGHLVSQRILWLAYCSLPYLEKNSGRSMTYPGTPFDYPCEAQFSAFTNARSMSPREVTFTKPGREKNSVLGKLDVSATTNVAGFKIPTEFVFTANTLSMPERRTSSREYSITNKTTRVTKVASERSLIPAIGGRANIQDYRFPAGSLAYVSQSGEWITRDEFGIEDKIKDINATGVAP